MKRKILFCLFSLLLGAFVSMDNVSAAACKSSDDPTKTGNCSTVAACTGSPASTNDCDIPAGEICCISAAAATPTTTESMPYTLLEKIPGENNTRAGDLPTYLQALYKFTFWAIGVSALLMLSVGGFMYVTSAGNTSRMGTAKEIIFDSIIGIVIALLAWLFLYIINPDFLSMKLPTVGTVTTTPGAAGTPTPGLPAPSGSAQDLATKILAAGSGVTLASSGECKMTGNIPVTPSLNINEVKTGGTMTACSSDCKSGTLCTRKTNISTSMLQAMLDIGQKYPFTVTSIAGGQHGPGSGHYSGTNIDIVAGPKTNWPAVLAAFKKVSTFAMCEKPNGAKTPDNDCSAADHIHIAF